MQKQDLGSIAQGQENSLSQHKFHSSHFFFSSVCIQIASNLQELMKIHSRMSLYSVSNGN